MGGVGSGGARSRSGGPLPDPYALKRQRDGKEWTKLPAAGRLEPAPEWPDEVDAPNEDELLMWRRIWMLPQSLVWEADHIHDMVAFYVRTYLEAMKPRAGAQARTFVGQMSEKLLLTPASLTQQRYVIDNSDDARAIDAALADHSATPKRGGVKKSARERMGVIKIVPEPDEDEDEQPETDVAASADDKDIPF